MWILINKETNSGYSYSVEKMSAFNEDIFTQVYEPNDAFMSLGIEDFCLVDNNLAVKITDNTKVVLNKMLGDIRYNKEKDGFKFNDLDVSMDREHIALMNACIAYYTTTDTNTVVYKHKHGWVDLTIEEFKALNNKQLEFFYSLLLKENSFYTYLTSSTIVTIDTITSSLAQFSSYIPEV